MADFGEGKQRSSQEVGRGEVHPQTLHVATHGGTGFSPAAVGTRACRGSEDGKMLGSSALKASSPPYVRIRTESAAPTLRRGALGDLERSKTLLKRTCTQGARSNATEKLSANPCVAMGWADRSNAQGHTADEICMVDDPHASMGADLEGSLGGLHGGRKQLSVKTVVFEKLHI